MAKGAYIGVPKEFDDVFANNSWAQIIKACQMRNVPSTWEVGDRKAMNIGGTDYLIDIIGKNHDDYADGSGKAPLTFQMHDCYQTTYRMNSSATREGGWAASEMRLTHLPAIMALMPSEVQKGIKEVTKTTNLGGSNSPTDTTSDKLFLLSGTEIWSLTSSSPFGTGGVQYAYYAAAGRSSNKTKVNTTTNLAWWTRCPLGNYSGGTYEHFVLAWTHSSYNSVNANETYGVAFAFCFGGTSEINTNFGGSSVARKIKKAYVGISDVARKIKKAYIGIGGVARPCWSGGELAYYGAITPLSVGRQYLDGASNSNYALFGGGASYTNGTTFYATVDAYNTSLTRSTPTALSNAVRWVGKGGGTSVGAYALFGGGSLNGSPYQTAAVDAYNTSLVKSVPTALSVSRAGVVATARPLGNYTLFAGGGGNSVVVDAYNASLTRTTPTTLSVGRASLGAVTTNSYIMFFGGKGGTNAYKTLDAYNSSLTRTAKTANTGYSATYGASTEVHALFTGEAVDKLVVFDNSLTERTIPQSTLKYYPAGASSDSYALFGGGMDASTNERIAIVDAYDTSLTHTTPTGLSVAKNYVATTTFGNRVLFGGGGDGGSSAVVDVYIAE